MLDENDDPVYGLTMHLKRILDYMTDAFKIEKSSKITEYVIQNESGNQYKITIEQLNSFKDAPWNS